MISKKIIIMMIACVCAFGFFVNEAQAAEPSTEVRTEIAESGRTTEDNLYNMGRGLVNIVTCWLEIPRCFIYHNSQVPVMGAVVGLFEGCGFTVVRAFAGVADFISLGYMSDSIYNSTHEFKEWVWDSRWIPQE